MRKRDAKTIWNKLCAKGNREKVVVATLCGLLLCVYVARAQQNAIQGAFERGKQEGATQAEATIYAQMAYQAEQEAAHATPEPIMRDGTTYQQLKTEAESVAKVLYGMQDNTDAGKRLAVWCVINRVGSYMYPSTIAEVCSQDKQWMGYSNDNPVIQSLYSIAYEELEYWHNGGLLPMNTDYVFLGWTQREITLRTDFEEKNHCKYWYESDWTEFEEARETT